MPPRIARKPHQYLSPWRSPGCADSGGTAGSRAAVRKPSASARWRRSSACRSRRPTGILPTARRCWWRSRQRRSGSSWRRLREAIAKPSKRSKLSRFAQAAVEFGLRRNGIYRLMFASRIMACAPKEQRAAQCAAMETFALLVEALEAPAVGFCASAAR